MKLEDNFPLCLIIIENTISYLLLNFSSVSQGLDNSCSNEYEAYSGIQNITAKGLLMSEFSQFISLKNIKFRNGQHFTHMTDICMPFCQILLSAW